MDSTALAVVPKWFEWLGWIAALAALQYLEEKSGSRIVGALRILSMFFLFYYFSAFFFRFRLSGSPWISTRGERVISLLLSGIVAYAVWWFAIRVAEILATNPAP